LLNIYSRLVDEYNHSPQNGPSMVERSTSICYRKHYPFMFHIWSFTWYSSWHRCTNHS